MKEKSGSIQISPFFFSWWPYLFAPKCIASLHFSPRTAGNICYNKTLSAAFGRSAILYFDRPQAPFGSPEVLVGEILPTWNPTSDIRHIKGVDNVPADALSRGINSFLLEPLIDIQTFSKERRKDEHLQRLLREKNTAFQPVLISYPNNTENIICDTHGQITSVRTCIFMQRHFYRGT